MHDRVVKLGSEPNQTFWPAWSKGNDTLVDLRTFNHEGTDLIYRADALRRAGVPEPLIELASTSEPPGFILFASGPANA